MRILFLILFIPFFAFLQQTKKNAFFLNEYNVSCNHSIYNLPVNTFGFGFGAYKNFQLKKNIALTTGLEYNFSQQIQGYEFNGGHNNSQNSTNDFMLSLNAISLPFYARLTFGRKLKMFLEPGVFVESIFSTKQKADVLNNSTESDIITFSNGRNVNVLNYGGSFGLGISYPIKNMECFIKPELRFGMLNNRYLRICLGIRFL